MQRRNLSRQLMYQELADRACERITAAITYAEVAQNKRPVKAILDPYNPEGSTRHVKFNTSKEDRWQTHPGRCHLNWVILDSDWCGRETHRYLPDFVVRVDDGQPDPLNVVVEIKGYRGEDAKDKKLAMDTYWIPGVNRDGRFGRWAFAEFTDIWTVQSGFEEMIAKAAKSDA
ncbi:MAG: hypothetical protein SFV18_15470 [Bryobacteraceae bacterium]|nr:hypothetical protein [Bryobacteraceae bacterium]